MAEYLAYRLLHVELVRSWRDPGNIELGLATAPHRSLVGSVTVRACNSEQEAKPRTGEAVEPWWDMAGSRVRKRGSYPDWGVGSRRKFIEDNGSQIKEGLGGRVEMNRRCSRPNLTDA